MEKYQSVSRVFLPLHKSGLHCTKQLVAVGGSLGHQVGAGSFLASGYSRRIINWLDFLFAVAPLAIALVQIVLKRRSMETDEIEES